MAAPGNNGDELRTKTQQSPLASQRAKEEGQPQVGRFTQWFPLGAKEGFNQWVSGLDGGARPCSSDADGQ